MFTYYIYSLGIIPFLASRAMIPIFATAVLARIGPEWDWLADYAGIQLVSGLPTWMTSNMALLVLALGALAELISQKSPHLRELWGLGDPVIKGVAAFFLCFQLVEGDFAELWQILMTEGPGASYVWGHSFAYTWSFAIGWCVWGVAMLRGGIYSFLTEMDEDDDLRIQGILSWLEDGMGFLGVIFVVLLPTLALITAGTTVLLMWLCLRYIRHREEKKKVPCRNCGHPNHECASRCPACHQDRNPVNQVGILGMIRRDLVTDPEEHRLNMILRKRCHSCGERLHERRANQTCPRCATSPFNHPGDLERYLSRLSEQLPKTLLISSGLSLIPLLGLIPGIIYYRINLISGLRAYIPIAGGCLTRWLVRILNLFLICLQPIPLVGMLTLPLMCLTNYYLYRMVFTAHARKVLPQGVAAAA